MSGLIKGVCGLTIALTLGLWPTVAGAQGPPAEPLSATDGDNSTHTEVQTQSGRDQVESRSQPKPTVADATTQHDHPSASAPSVSTPDARTPPLTGADRLAAFPDVQGHPVHDSSVNYFVLFDQLERQEGGTNGGVIWDNTGWIGGDLNRFWFRTEGDGEGGRLGTAQAHVLYGRAIARWWDVVAGVRQDLRPGPAQTWAAVGIQGLAPYWFEVEATAYVGASGRTAVRFETQYELLLTNRLILQPLVDLEIYGKADPEHGIGAGLSTADAGLRLRYEFRRQFAPYVGVVWNRKFFGTADLANAAGEKSGGARLAAGLRFWF